MDITELDEMFIKHGDFILFRMKDKTTSDWEKWKWYSECTQEEKEQANLRGLFADEVVLDLEEPERADEVKAILIKDKYTFEMWATGSRGWHINLIFPEMSELDEELRKRYREYFIRITNTCPSKRTGLLALENRPHFKTGNIKTKVLDFNSKNETNTLPQIEIVDFLLGTLSKDKVEKNYYKCFTKKIEDYIDVTKFKKNKSELQGSHPFHGSTTGLNFSVNTEKQVWHCFRHDCGGNILHLVGIKHGLIQCGDPLDVDLLKIIEAGEKEGIKRRDGTVFDDFADRTEKSVEDVLSNKVIRLLLNRQRNEATELVVQTLLKDNNIYTTRHDEVPEMWIYLNGIFVPDAKTYITEFCRKVLGTSYTTAFSNQVISKIEADTYITQEDFFIEEDINLVPLKNGILNIRTRELTEFSPRYRFFNKLPITYDPEADCPFIKKHFREVLSSEEDVNVMQEIFGYLLLRDYKIEKAFMFTGSGRNGKGKSIELMKRFIGPQNVSSISLQDFEKDPFAMGELFHKMANLCSDLSRETLKNTGYFKQLTGHDLITAARKYLNRVSFVNYAKLIYSCNELPITYDETIAFFDRWILLDFKHTFLSEQEIANTSDEDKKTLSIKIADSEIINKLSTQEELNGLLNWALDGLDRVLEKQDFSQSASIEKIKTVWLRKSSSIRAFILDEIAKDWSSPGIVKSIFKQRYSDYCFKNNLRPASDKTIKYALENACGAAEARVRLGSDEPQHVWLGIKFK